MFLKQFIFIVLSILVFSCSSSESELITAAKKELDNNSYNDAIKYLDEAISVNNNNARTYNMRGVAHFQLDNYLAAVKDFNTAISLDSSNYKPYYNRGNLNLERKEYENALIDYNRAIELLPNNADLYINRAIVLYELKQFKSAIADNEFAIKLAPTNYLPYLNNAKTFIKLGEFEKAEDLLSPMVENNINIGEVYYWLAFVQINTGRNLEGCDNLIKAKNRSYEQAQDAIDKFCTADA